MLDNGEVKKIIEQLQKIHSEKSEAELEEIAENLWKLSLFLVHLKIKEIKNNPP